MKAALLAILVLVLAVPVLAQQAPAPPPTWQQGRSPDQASSPLAPHAQPPAPKAASEIPVNTIKVPAGFKVELWASGIDNARAMTWGDKGTLFVSSRGAGNVYAIVDQNGRREVKTIAKGLQMPNGVAFKDGALYVAEISRITKYEGIENNLDSVPQPKVVIDTLPKDLPHGWKYLSFGPDGKLYFNIGAPCNICMPPETHAAIVRINADGTGLEYVARGVRNSVGHDFHPVTKELYFSNHGRDWLGEDVPNDTLHHVVQRGVHFGYPMCHQGDILDPAFGAEKGSWNKTDKIGFRVTMLTLQAGRPPKEEVFAEGWMGAGGQFWGRPAYVQEMKDGSLLIADDYAGAIYRVSYQK